ncbi:hypothetical protein D4764_0103370 [Takifugu flavidus]|uniref:Uncharacterized protein n=1 Tax=Takifugu flavidus TaxID=433684 RepID=A0A5C6MMW5_9TELE|nr:hypothetical protein D4764_0103370 [Takifugu flavidus]
MSWMIEGLLQEPPAHGHPDQIRTSDDKATATRDLKRSQMKTSSFWELCCRVLPAGGVVEPFSSLRWRRRKTHLRSIGNLASYLKTELPFASGGVFWSLHGTLTSCD